MLALLIVSMALHFVLIGIALYCFGAEGVSTPALTETSFDAGLIEISGQSLCVGAVCLVMVAALRWFFVRTLFGKALRAAASDRLGARLIGVDHALSGRAAFALASFAAAVSGLLIAPITPLSYDTGFEIGLKGFVAAVMGGLASYPLAAAGALVVGLLESFSGFWASQYRNIIVFSLLIPVLIWLSLARGNTGGPRLILSPVPRAQQATLALAVCAALPFALSEYQATLAGFVGIAAIAALGLVLLTGISGQTSFGHATFVGLAAYTTALLSRYQRLAPVGWTGGRAGNVRRHRLSAGSDHLAHFRPLPAACHDRLVRQLLLLVRCAARTGRIQRLR